MSPRTKEQLEIIRQEKKSKILDVALHVFAEQGYHSASISKIARGAGISKGLIYTYFQSKEEILITLVEEMADKMLERFPVDDVEPTDELIEQYIDLSFDIIQEDMMHAKLFFSMYVQPEVLELVSARMMERVVPFMHIMTRYFKDQGQKDPEAMMRYFSAAIDGVQMHIMIDPKFPIEQTKTFLKQQFIKP